MAAFITDIEQATISNSNYRHVLYTASHMQLVVMSLRPKEEIGMEVHQNNDQFFRIEKGSVKVILNGEENILTQNMVLIVPAGTNHNVINIGDEEAKLYTIYAPANHQDGTLQATKPQND
jgi:mannose-6-phosphate isomerase-like protein (cupin superfamily)